MQKYAFCLENTSFSLAFKSYFPIFVAWMILKIVNNQKTVTMKKRYFLSVVALMCVLSVCSEPITKSNAMQIAQEFLQKQGKNVRSQPARAPRMQNGVSRLDEDAASYYVFNSSDGEGYVIVSGDDQTDPILGYSMKGNFDEENMPENLRAWLDDYARQIELISQGKAQAARVPIHSADISQKMTTTWNQDYPYNAYCSFNGAQCVTGCAATAISQVMNWNKWPQESTTVVPGYTTKTRKYTISSVPSVTFDWANMIDDYSVGYTSAQATAVAQLMRYVGQGALMDYGPSSGANFGNAMYALVNYFHYDSDIRYEKACSYTITQWDDMIYNELKLRPVLYEGYSTGGGHAFVIDGYKSSDGTYYVNWGWGGQYDGFYRLRVMDAKGGGIGASSTSDGYAQSQGAIFDMKPENGVQETAGRYLRGIMSLETDGNNMKQSIQNPYFEDLVFEYGMAKLNSDGSVSEVYDVSTYSLVHSGYYQFSYIPASNYGMTAGNTYKFAFVSREHGDTEWHKAYDDKCYFEVVFRSYNDYDVIVHPHAELVATGTGIAGSYRAMDQHSFDVSLRNDGEEFDNLLYFFLQTPDDEDYKLTAQTSLALEAGQEDGVSFSFTPMSSGTYFYKVTTDEAGINSLAVGNLEIFKAKFLPTRLEYGNDGDNLNITFENNNDATYNYPVIIQLYEASDGKLTNYIDQYNNPYATTYFIEPNSSKVLPFNVGSLEPGEYGVRIWYDSDFNGGANVVHLTDIFFTVGDDGKAVVGIRQIEADATVATSSTGIYDLNGRKVANGQLPKGIYIKDGKKVVM